MPLNDVLLMGRDQALEHRDLTADSLTAFRLPNVSRLSKLLDLLHRRNDVSALAEVVQPISPQHLDIQEYRLIFSSFM